MQRTFWVVCVAFLFWVGGNVAMAQSSSGHISQGKLLYNAQEYDKAVGSFRKAMAAKDATDATKAVALKHLGLIAVILRKPKAARRYFLKLLQLQPSFQLDSSHSPKLVKAFDKVKQEFDKARKVTIADLTARTVPSAQPLELRIKLRDKLKQAAEVTLWYRIEGRPGFTKRAMQEVNNPSWQARLQPSPAARWAGHHQGFGHRISICADKQPAARPAARPAKAAAQATGGMRYYTYSIPKFVGRTVAYDIEYYVIATDAKGKAIAKVGSAASPKRVRRTVELKKKTTPAPTPVYKKWWLWTIIGVGVAGGVVAVVVATLPKAPPTPETGAAVITIIKPKY